MRNFPLNFDLSSNNKDTYFLLKRDKFGQFFLLSLLHTFERLVFKETAIYQIKEQFSEEKKREYLLHFYLNGTVVNRAYTFLIGRTL